MDIVQVLAQTDRPRKYWNDLKSKLKAEGSELSEKIGQLERQPFVEMKKEALPKDETFWIASHRNSDNNLTYPGPKSLIASTAKTSGRWFDEVALSTICRQLKMPSEDGEGWVQFVISLLPLPTLEV